MRRGGGSGSDMSCIDVRLGCDKNSVYYIYFFLKYLGG